MSLKEIIQLKDKKVVYVLEENDSTYIYRKQKVTGYTLTLVCRKRIHKNVHKFKKKT